MTLSLTWFTYVMYHKYKIISRHSLSFLLLSHCTFCDNNSFQVSVLSIVVKSLTSKLTSCSSTVWYSRFLHVLDCDCDIIRFNTIYTKSFMLYIEERWHYLWLDSHMWCIISIRLYLGILCRFFCFRTALFVTTILSRSQYLLDDAKLSYISCLSWVSIQIFFHTWTLFCE